MREALRELLLLQHVVEQGKVLRPQFVCCGKFLHQRRQNAVEEQTRRCSRALDGHPGNDVGCEGACQHHREQHDDATRQSELA